MPNDEYFRLTHPDSFRTNMMAGALSPIDRAEWLRAHRFPSDTSDDDILLAIGSVVLTTGGGEAQPELSAYRGVESAEEFAVGLDVEGAVEGRNGAEVSSHRPTVPRIHPGCAAHLAIGGPGSNLPAL